MYPTLAAGTGLRLHMNEHTGGCSPAVERALHSITRLATACYPDDGPATGRAARWFDVPEGWVQLVNGLDEGLLAAALASARRAPGRTVRFIEPAFEMYDAVAGAAGLATERVPSGPDFAFPLNQLLGTSSGAPGLVFLTDPNNPTGLGIPAGAIEQIAAALPDTLVLADEAYAEFSGRTCIGALLDRHRNLIAGRTFAKAYGLAGLRIGALVAHPDTLASIRQVLLPYSASVFALRALEAALDDPAYVAWTVAQSAESRRMVYDFCAARGLTCWPSEANFVLVRVGDDAPAIVDAAGRRGLLIRDRSRMHGCAGCVRVTAGVVDHTRAGLSILEETLASRAH
jgi:histidinol-phosphate aminotransferase